MRIGNEIYSKTNKTFGLTTLQKKHVIFDNESDMYFKFIGKRHVEHKIKIEDQSKKYINFLVQFIL